MHSRRVGRPVTMWIHSHARGTRGHAPPERFDINGEIWCILGIPKYVIINLKINNLRIIMNDNNNFGIFFSNINQDKK